LKILSQLVSRKNLSKRIFGNNQLFPLLGIHIGLTQPEKEADSIVTIPCLDPIGLSITEHTPGFFAIPKNPATVKDITV
jgi:hypothetical protein